MQNKILRFLGLARRSGNLISGYNTCIHYINKNKIKLLIIAEDASENTKKKFIQLALKKKIKYIVWGNKDDLSHSIGMDNRSVIGIDNENFVSAILAEFEK